MSVLLTVNASLTKVNVSLLKTMTGVSGASVVAAALAATRDSSTQLKMKQLTLISSLARATSIAKSPTTLPHLPLNASSVAPLSISLPAQRASVALGVPCRSAAFVTVMVTRLQKACALSPELLLLLSVVLLTPVPSRLPAVLAVNS